MFCVLENKVDLDDNIKIVDFLYTTFKNDKLSCTVSILKSERNIMFIG